MLSFFTQHSSSLILVLLTIELKLTSSSESNFVTHFLSFEKKLLNPRISKRIQKIINCNCNVEIAFSVNCKKNLHRYDKKKKRVIINICYVKK